MKTFIDGTPRCGKDGFPLLKINGRLECAAEYLERCIGGDPIVDVVKHDKIAYYIFANGHELPLLCSCCGSGLLCNEDVEREKMRGRRVTAINLGVTQVEGESPIEQFVLRFSPTEQLPEGIVSTTAFESAVRMKHPADCPHTSLAPGQAPAPSQKPVFKKKKKRR